MFTWPIIKGTATLSTGIMGVLILGKPVAMKIAETGLLGEAVNANSSISIEGAVYIAGGAIVFALWVTNKFDTAVKATARAEMAAEIAKTTAKELEIHIQKVEDVIRKIPCLVENRTQINCPNPKN